MHRHICIYAHREWACPLQPVRYTLYNFLKVIYACTYANIYLYAYINAQTYVHAYIYAQTYTCIHIYMHIYTNTDVATIWTSRVPWHVARDMSHTLCLTYVTHKCMDKLYDISRDTCHIYIYMYIFIHTYVHLNVYIYV